MHKHEIYYNPVRVNLAHMVRENITLLKGVAINKKICLQSQVDESINIFVDEYMITTVIRNLIYNAIKFTPKKGKIIISSNETEPGVEISIKDTGVGISPKNIETLFQSDVYYTTKGTSKETGIGLGLMLCKDFIEKNGGEIQVESIKGQGSTFKFTLPKWKSISIN